MGEYHIKTAGDRLEFKMYGLEVDITNVPFAPDNPDEANKFTADVKICMEVPVYFAGMELVPVKIALKVRAGYTPKYF